MKAAMLALVVSTLVTTSTFPAAVPIVVTSWISTQPIVIVSAVVGCVTKLRVAVPVKLFDS